MDRETPLLEAVDPLLVVTFAGAPVCPGLPLMPSTRVAVLEIKVSNEPGCAR